jgi:hypothetical protein
VGPRPKQTAHELSSPLGGGIVRRLAKVLDNLIFSELGLGVKEPTAPKASRNTVPNEGMWLAC